MTCLHLSLVMPKMVISRVKSLVYLLISVRLWSFMGPKKHDFWPKINILKGKHCILGIRGAPVRQILGMILENKGVQKLKLEKSFLFTKNGLLN